MHSLYSMAFKIFVTNLCTYLERNIFFTMIRYNELFAIKLNMNCELILWIFSRLNFSFFRRDLFFPKKYSVVFEKRTVYFSRSNEKYIILSVWKDIAHENWIYYQNKSKRYNGRKYNSQPTAQSNITRYNKYPEVYHFDHQSTSDSSLLEGVISSVTLMSSSLKSCSCALPPSSAYLPNDRPFAVEL